MIDFNGVIFGTCLFIASFMSGLRKPVIRELVGQSSSKVSMNNQECALIDFLLPSKDTEIIQNLANDEIIAKSVAGGPCKKIYVNIQADESSSTSQVLNYMSKLYSTIWNEAALQSALDIECYIVSDLLGQEGTLTRKDILLLPELRYFATTGEESIEQFTKLRANANLPPVECTNVNATVQPLFDEYALQPSITVLDAPHEQQPRDLPKFSVVALGGTFDKLHFGHCKLLTLASLCCTDTLLVGITSDSMLTKKSHASKISPFAQRKNGVQNFLGNAKISERLKVDLIEINDPFGPTVTNPDIDAIIVSSETIRGAFKINRIRAEKGMKRLHILVTYRTDPVVLSSTFIRESKSRSVDGSLDS
mmetsp:Transcript_4933/g.8033  ORF Transcript_4933/g.8033 Transcript_4933/m.8033 type:complete len:364 (+) Transcript_4933:54-1145(+)